MKGIRHRINREIGRRFLLGAALLAGGMALLLGFLSLSQTVWDKAMKDDLSPLYEDPALLQPVAVEGAEPQKMVYSSEYNAISLVCSLLGEPVTEEELREQNSGQLACGGAQEFAQLLESRLPGYEAEVLKKQPDTMFLTQAHESLSKGIPVPFEYLAQEGSSSEKNYRLHLGVMVAMDLGKDSITVLSPFGEKEEYTVQGLLQATHFETGTGLPWYEYLALLSGDPSKNTLFLLRPLSHSQEG